MIDRALAHGVRVQAWTFDELYGRDSAFLDGLEQRGQVFVAEVPTHFHGWVLRPRVLRDGPSPRRGPKKKYPRLARRRPSSAVQNLARYAPIFQQQTWQRYRIKDTQRGPEVWEVKWAVFWRKGSNGLPGRRHCLIVARNVLTGEVKYFVSNRVPGERGITLRRLLVVAFQRWSVESCFRQAKEELGRDPLEHLTMEQVRRAMNAWLQVAVGPRTPTEHFERELAKQQYYQRRNTQAQRSHTKTRKALLRSLGIDADSIKSCIPRPPA